MEAEIETGEYSQEEIVDNITNTIGGEEASTDLGAEVEGAVERFYTQLGLNIPADRRSRDYLAQNTDRTLNASTVTGKVEGQPWVHTDDDFLLFLEWLIRQEGETGEAKYTARSVVDAITSPTDGWVLKLYQTYLNQKGKEEADPYL